MRSSVDENTASASSQILSQQDNNKKNTTSLTIMKEIGKILSFWFESTKMTL
jgi:hypothetical protein